MSANRTGKTQRRPDLELSSRHHAREMLRIHANNRYRNLIQRDRLTDRRRTAPESPRPIVIADDRHRTCWRLYIVVRPDRPPDHRQNPQASIEVPRDHKTIQRLGVSIDYRRHAPELLKPEQALEHRVVAQKLPVKRRREVRVR